MKLSLDLPGDARYIRIARLIGRSLLEHLNVVSEPIDDVESVIGELCTNVIRHSHDTSGRFTVDIEYHADRVVLVVQDLGAGFAFADVPAAGSTRIDEDGTERVGGFGLGLVRAFSDKLDFYRTDPHGTTVRAERLLRYRTEEDLESARTLEAAGAADGMRVSLA